MPDDVEAALLRAFVEGDREACPDGDVAREVGLALRELSPKLRVVAMLALVEERPLAEIADALDVPVLEVPSQFVFGIPAAPLERMIMFPMAVVPNLWGVWNMLYLRLKPRLPLPAFGALLPMLLVGIG